MNKTKRFLGLFLVVFMLLAFVPLQALANTVDEIAPVGSDSQTTEVASATDETLPDGVTADSFGDNTVTDGTNYYADLQTAVEAVCGVNNAVLYCKPSADVGSLQHAPVISSLTIYGNGASVTGGAERDFDIGNTDPSLGKDVTGDMTLKVVSLNGCGAWGAKATEHTVNLVFENCQNMGKVFLTGTTGTLNISITDCAFEGVIAEAIYSNANGDICVSGVEFSNLNKAINLNHKAEGEQNITIENCTFTNCGNDVSADQIPVRVLSSVEGGVSVLTVSGCTFTGTPEGGADILLDYNANGTTVYDITSTTAGVLLENENGNGVITNVNADADFSNKQGYLIYIYNADGSIGMVINSTKSASEFCLRTAIEDARVFVDNAFLFGITTPATYVVEMYEDSTENESFEIGSDVTINGNGFEIVCADGVEVTVAEGATLNNVVMPEAPAAPVASVNGVEYADLQAAIDAASNGDTIVLLGNITLVSQEFTYPNYNRLGYCGVVIPDGKQLVLDLAGYTVSYSDAYGDFDNCMIINIGDLTINDTVGSGKIYYHANNNELATATYAYLHATILNGGKLVLNEGVTVENYAPADVDVTAALDNHSHFSYSYENDAICIINGANLISNKYFAIRQYTHYKTGYANDVTINDGTVTAIYLQHGDSWYYPDPADERLARATLTINGGTIKTLQAAEDWTCPAVRMAMSNPDNPNIQLSITGGVIDDVKIAVRRGYHYNENGTLVNETTADRNTEWLAANGGFITGGTFTNIGSADDITTNLVSFLADGFELVENADGTYGVNELPTGTLTNAYTSASGYWGECGGNAKESFGFKLYYNDTFMGSTFLNNVGGIIDGDVYVSWNIKLDAESNTDEYWTMSWEIAPTIAMQPNRVEQWVDGVCVANVELEPNWSDRIFPVVAAVTDADGKILSYVNNYDGATLANAFANANEGDEVVLLADVAFAENAASIVINKAITIDGNGKQLTFDSATSAFVIQSSNVTIKNVTIVQGAKDNSFAISISKGAWDAPAIQYSNITISEVDFVGGDYALCLIGENVVVDGCTFTEQDSHNVIVYSLKGESAITNNVFNASNGNNKSAILWEGGADNATDLSGFIAGGKLTIDGNEVNGKGVFFQFTNWGLVEGVELVITNNEIDAFTNKAIALYDMDGAITADGDEFESVVISQNVFTNVPAGRPILKEYTGTVNVDASGNYLGSEAPDVGTLLVGAKVSVDSYYADEALTELVSIALAGSGTEEDPYLITSFDDLKLFRDLVNNGTYVNVYAVLTDNIDMEQEDWVSIGTSTHPFTGTFDGKGFTISNIWSYERGLFGYTSKGNYVDSGLNGRATIKNLTIEGVEVYNQSVSAVGGLVGQAGQNTEISNVTVTGYISIYGYGYVGGIVGQGYAHIDNCQVIGVDDEYDDQSTISANYWAVGGIIGHAGSEGGASITNCSVENVKIYSAIYGAGSIAGVGTTGPIENVSAENVVVEAGSDPDANGFLVGCNYDKITGNSTAKNITMTVGGAVVSAPQDMVANVNGTYYISLQAAVDAANTGDTITILANVADEAVTVNKNVTITSDADNKVTLNNVSITINGTDVELTVSNLKFTGSSYINAGNGKALTVTGVEANVEPAKITGRAAFIVTGTSEPTHGLKLVVTDNVINSAQSGTDYYSAAIFGWRYIDDGSVISGNIFGTEDNRYTFVAVKTMNAMDGATITIANNTIYGTSESYVLLAFDLYQNNSRANAYTVISNSNVIDATVGSSYPVIAFNISGNTAFADSTNITLLDNGTTVNGNALTLADIDANDAGSDYDKYYGVGVVTDANGKIIGGTFGGDMAALANDIADGYEVVDGVVSKVQVAEVNGVKYATLAEAAAAAQAGDEIVLLADAYIAEGTDVTIPAGVILNGNGFSIYASGADYNTTTNFGYVIAGGNLTIKGITKIEKFSASYYDHVITIGEGASLQVFGKNRVSLGYGSSFDIVGSIDDAKTADKSAVTPSLVISAGISIVGANDTYLKATNAYVVIGSTSSKNSNAGGTFDITFDNCIVEFTNQFTTATPKYDTLNPVFNVTFKDSTVTAATKFCFMAPGSNVVVDNSDVTLGTYLHNSGSVEIKNGSTFVGSMIQYGENGGNSGTITVDNASFTIKNNNSAYAMDGKDTGKLILTNGATASVDYIKATEITIGVGTELTTKSADLTANTEPGYEVEYADGKYVAVLAPVAQIGDVKYATLEEAIAAAQAGETVELLGNVTVTGSGAYIMLNKAITIDGNGYTVSMKQDTAFAYALLYLYAIDGTVTIKDTTFDGITSGAVIWAHDADVVIDNCVFQNGNHTQVQGLVRTTCANLTLTNSKFINNNCNFVITFNYDAAESDKMVVENCTFSGNTVNDTAVIYYVDGASSTITDSSFVGNTVNSASHGAIVYYSNGQNGTVTGNEFIDNTITAAGARATVLALEAGTTATENAFVNNTCTSTASGTTYVGTVLNKADADSAGVVISGNYWNGGEPDAIASKGAPTTIENYYTTYENGVLGGLTALVAEVNGVKYATLQEALNAGGEVVLLTDIVLTEGVTVPAGTTVTLDLAGHTVSREIASAEKSTSVITNYGTLTVKDSSGNNSGKISINYTGASYGYGVGIYAISNEGGTLTIVGGTIENLTPVSGSMYDAIDNNSTLGNTVLNIEGGIISCPSYIGIRQFCNDTANANVVNVTNGVITGGNTSIWMQNPNDNDNNGALNITGGTFNGRLLVGDLDVFAPAVSGGTFSVAVPEEYCAEGFACVENADGTYGIKKTYAEVSTWEELANAVADKYITDIKLTADITAEGRLVVDRDLNIDLNGKTLSLTQVNNRVWKAATLTINGNGKIDVSAVDGGNVFYVGSAETGAGTNGNLVLENIEVYGDNYNTGTNAAVFMLYGPASSTLNITNCELNLSNNRGNGSVFYDTGTNNQCKINIVDSELNFNGTVRGSVCGDITIDNSTVVIKNCDNGFNEATLTIKNGSDVTITDNTGRGITVNRNGYGIVIEDSTVYLANNGEGDIRYKASANITITNSDLNLCNVVVDDGKVATINGLAVENGATVQSVDGVVTINNPVAQIGDVKYATLQEAIAAAQNGDTITLLADVELDASITVTKSITIDGNGNKITQSANCDNTHALLYFDANDVLDITIENVTFDGIKGGAAIRTLGANMTIDNCVFQNCEHTQVQGLVRLTQGKASITNTKFLNNNCSMAVSFNYDTAGLEGDTFVIDNCVFEGNTADTTAIVYYVKGEGCTITNSEFVGNTVNCDSNGAVIYLGFQEDCKVTGCLFENNTVTDSSTSTRVAGAIFFGYAADISGNAFINNTATNANGDVLGQVCTSTYYDCEIDLSGNYWGSEAPVYGKDYTVQHQTGDAEFALDSYYESYELDTNGNVVVGGEVSLNYVAQVGKFKYETVTEAINACADGGTVKLLAGTITETINPWGTDSTHASEKSITIVGAENFGTTLTGGLVLGYDDSGCRAHTITIEGIAFEGMGVVVAGQQNVVIKNNKFTNITATPVSTSTANANAISVLGKNINATVTGNVIDGAAVAGINLRDIANATVSGNTISNTQHNSITITTTGTGETITVTDNVLSNWGLGGEGRAIRVSGGATVEINGNVMIHQAAPEQFVKVTGATSANVNENYWSGKSPVDAGVIDVAAATPENYYADADKTNLVSITYVAEVNGVKYSTLAEAIAAAGEGATITLLNNATGDVTVAEGQNITIDLNGNDIVGTLCGITNNGTLVINDTVGTGNVYTTDVSAQGRATIVNNGTITINGGWFGDSNNDTTDRNAINRGNAIKNSGVATINGGYFTNVSNQYIDANAYAYAINTLAGGTTTINNATVYGDINGLIFSDGKTIVNDGSFTLGRPGEENNLWYLAYGDVEIKGGTWTRAFAVPSWNTGDPTFEGTVQISGGTFNVNVKEQYCAKGFIVEDNGDGTYGIVKDPYAISSLEELKAFRDKVNAGDKCYGETWYLTTDIDLLGEEWTPIGTNDHPFQGTFDGKGYTISNLVITGRNNKVGLFGRVNNTGGELKNLTIHNAMVSGDSEIGALVGTPGTFKISNIKLTGHVAIDGYQFVGAVGGKNANADWNNVIVDVDDTSFVKATSTVDGTKYTTHVGGVIGMNGNIAHSLTNISSNIKVIGDVKYIGGLFGTVNGNNTIENVTFTGTVEAAEGATHVGAIAGVWVNTYGQEVVINNADYTNATVKVGDTAVDQLVGGVYYPAQDTADTSGKLIVDGEQKWPLAAKIGSNYYATLAEAIAALQDGQTLTILESFTAEANMFIELNGKKNVTITAADGVVINGNISIGYHASHVDGVDRSNTTLTVDGLVVNGTLTVCSNDKNLVVENCEAAQITVKTYAENMSITLADNVADGSMGTAANSYGMFIVPNATGYDLVLDGNTFKNVQSHAFTIQGCGDGAAVTAANSITVTDNVFESWGLNGKSDRAAFKIWADTKYAPASGSDVNETTNAMRELVNAIEAGNNTFASTAENTVEFDIYDIAADAVEIPDPFYAAEVNGVKYATLAEAIAAAQAGETVTVLNDVTLDATITIENAITLDLGGKTVTGADGAIVFNLKADTKIVNGTINGNKSGTSSGLIDIYANLDMDGVTVETSKINALRFKAGDCTATLTNCNVTGAFKGYGGSVWNIVSGTYKASSTSVSEQLNGTAQVSGGTFYYEIAADKFAPGYAAKDNGDGSYTVEYAPVGFVDVNKDGVYNDGDVLFGNLEFVFISYENGDVYVVLTDNAVINNQVDTTVNAKYYINTNVAEGVTVDFKFADDWNYIQKMTIGENVTVNAPYLLAWTELDVYGTINTGYLYTTTANVTINEGAVVNANTGDATVQVKNGATLTVNGTLNTAILNVWVGDSKLVVSGANAQVNASWIDIWDGTPTVTVENGATLAVESIKASRGGEITVTDATLDADNVILGHNNESAGKLTVNNGTVTGPIELTTVDSTIAGAEGMNVFTNIADHKVVYENGIYSVAAKVYVAQVGDTKYESLQDAINAADGETVVLIADIELNASIKVEGNVTLDLAGYTITGTDNNTSGNFYLFDVTAGASFTVEDSVGEGAITLTATNERNWNSSSVVIANNRGTVTVNGGRIEHFGGTSMAYALDNLTNGANTVATMVVNGGTIDSTYFAIRQFANNGTNNLTINGGDIGYVWMQSPNANANVASTTVNGGTVDGICVTGKNAVYTLKALATSVGEVYGTAPVDQKFAEVDGYYVLVDCVYVAEVNGVKYESLQEAIDAANAGDTVTLVANITVASDFNNAAKGLYNIAADDKITIDLGGYTIDVTDNSAGNFIVFYNYGELTIKNGTVNVTSTINREWNAQSTAILNRGGILTIESGSYVHNGGTDMAITVDNSGNSFGDAYLYVKGGTIESTYTGIRLRMADPSLNGNPGNGLVYTEITGGEIYGGSRGIWAQITNATSDELGSLAITGGTIGGGNNSLRITTDGHDNIDVTISGNAVINGAILGEGSDFAITGGTFDTPVAAELCADGYVPVDNGDGKYGVAVLWNVSLDAGTNLDMNFYIPSKLIDITKSYYAKVVKVHTTACGDESEVFYIPMGEWKNNGSYKQIVVKNIAADEMNCDIEVQIYEGTIVDGVGSGTALYDMVSMSVVDYSMMLLEYYPNDVALRTLVVDMLYYGAEAQIYFDHDPSELATRHLSETQKGYASEDKEIDGYFDYDGEYAYAPTITLADTIFLNFYFSGLSAIENYDATLVDAVITYTTHRGTLVEDVISSSNLVFMSNGDIVRVDVKSLSAADVDTVVKCELRYNGNSISSMSMNIAFYCEFSIGENTAETEICKKIMKYGASAKTYFQSKTISDNT